MSALLYFEWPNTDLCKRCYVQAGRPPEYKPIYTVSERLGHNEPVDYFLRAVRCDRCNLQIAESNNLNNNNNLSLLFYFNQHDDNDICPRCYDDENLSPTNTGGYVPIFTAEQRNPLFASLTTEELLKYIKCSECKQTMFDAISNLLGERQLLTLAMRQMRGEEQAQGQQHTNSNNNDNNNNNNNNNN